MHMWWLTHYTYYYALISAERDFSDSCAPPLLDARAVFTALELAARERASQEHASISRAQALERGRESQRMQQVQDLAALTHRLSLIAVAEASDSSSDDLPPITDCDVVDMYKYTVHPYLFTLIYIYIYIYQHIRMQCTHQHMCDTYIYLYSHMDAMHAPTYVRYIPSWVLCAHQHEFSFQFECLTIT